MGQSSWNPCQGSTSCAQLLFTDELSRLIGSTPLWGVRHNALSLASSALFHFGMVERRRRLCGLWGIGSSSSLSVTFGCWSRCDVDSPLQYGVVREVPRKGLDDWTRLELKYTRSMYLTEMNSLSKRESIRENGNENICFDGAVIYFLIGLRNQGSICFVKLKLLHKSSIIS